MRIAVVANTGWYLLNFRLNLIRALEAEGHDVLAIGSKDAFSNRIVDAGIRFKSAPFSGSGTNPLQEIRTVAALARIFHLCRIEAVLSYTPKGNIYSGLAALVGGVSTLPNVSGLGRAFSNRSTVAMLVNALYKLAFHASCKVFFQNQDDLRYFVQSGVISASKAEHIPGSGVDLSRFKPRCLASEIRSDGPIFLLIARLLWDKGVNEFVEASCLVRNRWPHARFQLLGFVHGNDPAGVPLDIVNAWVTAGLVEYLGATDDVRPFIAYAWCIVLPSYYREGVPRTLLEAAAMGKPVITTQFPGCRDAVDDGVTGFLCRPRDPVDLAGKMLRLLELPAEARSAMGKAGRAKMEREFDERLVIGRYLETVRGLAI